MSANSPLSFAFLPYVSRYGSHSMGGTQSCAFLTISQKTPVPDGPRIVTLQGSHFPPALESPVLVPVLQAREHPCQPIKMKDAPVMWVIIMHYNQGSGHPSWKNPFYFN